MRQYCGLLFALSKGKSLAAVVAIVVLAVVLLVLAVVVAESVVDVMSFWLSPAVLQIPIAGQVVFFLLDVT